MLLPLNFGSKFREKGVPTVMKYQPALRVIIGIALLVLTTSCAATKTLHVWKDDQYKQRLHKVLIIAVAEQDYMKDHFENVLAEQLEARGIEAVPGNKVFPKTNAKLERDVVLAKVKELGIGNVLIGRSVSKKEVSQLTPGGVYFIPVDFYSDYYGFYTDSFVAVGFPGAAYDAEYFHILTNVYDASSEKLIWSYLSQVKVEGSREGAINPFIDVLMKQLQDNNLL
jgi:hypothetical protein